MFYVGPTTLGNPNLKPESALSEEIGFKYNTYNIQFNVALFNRKSDDLIDWTKDNEADKWQTRNFSEVVSRGIETNFVHSFVLGNFNQKISLGYSFIDDDIQDNNIQFTRYSLNSIKHQFTSALDIKYSKMLSQNIAYRFVERTDGESYNVVDAKIFAAFKNGIELSLTANNIFNSEYTETNLVPMPKGNIMFGLKYSIY